MLTVRLVIKDQKGVILVVREMNRFQRKGVRNLMLLEKFLDEADEALKHDMHPTFEFLDYELQKEEVKPK